MFYILIISGIIFIILGITFNKKNLKVNKVEGKDLYLSEIYNEDIESLRETINRKNINAGNKGGSKEDEVELLELRLEKLEKMLFKQMLEKETSKPIVVEDKEELEVSLEEKDASEKYKLIKKYEAQDKSLDEIAGLLEMNKGEVILLKNLYKNS